MHPTTPLRGALIGCGFVSQHHLAAWPKVPDARLDAVCEIDPARLARAVELAPGAQGFSEAGTMFASQKFDFVEICTGPESHLPLVKLAADHGAHVLCQKPVSIDRADLLAMIDVCDRAGVRFMVHENWRWRPWYVGLRKAVRSGVVGRPIRFLLEHRDTRALRPDGFADQPFLATRCELILLEMGCHLVDAARFVMGEVASVSAVAGTFGEGHPGEDVATLSLRFASGALGWLDMSWCATAELARPEWALNRTVVEGTGGSLSVQTDGSLRFRDLHGREEKLPVTMPPDNEVYVDAYVQTQRHFVRGLLDGHEHATSGRDTLRTMDVVWGAYASAARGGAPVEFGTEGV